MTSGAKPVVNRQTFLHNFLRRNGVTLGVFLLLAVGIWIFVLILAPQLFMLDFSFRHSLPPAEIGGPKDTHTLEHYKFMIYGSAKAEGAYNTVDLGVFWRTLLAACLITVFDLLICYPIAYYLAKVATGGWGRLMVLSLIVPFWVNEILRAFAFRILFGTAGVINDVLVGVGVLSEQRAMSGSTAPRNAPERASAASRATLIRRRSAHPTSSARTSRCGCRCVALPG